jgi:hypothetical protein
MLSTSAFKFNLRRYITACENIDGCAKDPCYALVGRCRLTPG